MYLSILSTGRVRQKRNAHGIRRYFPGNWRDDTLPINVFLIEDADDLVLVDTGQTAAATRSAYFPCWHPFFRLSRFELGRDDEAAAQICRAGVEPGRVRRVVLTHLHTDHVGGVAAFPNAEVVVSRIEWESAQGLVGRVRGYLPQRWPAAARPRLVDFDGPPIGPFQASHDIASDGRFVLVPLAGHTPGHAGLLVCGGDRMYLCIGDAALRAAELGASHREVAEWCRRNDVVLLATHDDAAPRLLAAAQRRA